MIESKRIWINPSAKLLAGNNDPIDTLLAKVRGSIYKAIEKGFSGPPFDPFDFAKYLGITLRPNSEVADARIISSNDSSYRVEFNPNMSRSRIKFSIAHEIAHTFFPDCADTIRQRLSKQEMTPGDCELEMLCNIGAAEILMPVGSFPKLKEEAINLANLLHLRRKYEVSTEAVLLRAIRLTDASCIAFAASKNESSSNDSNYKFDYIARSNNFQRANKYNLKLPENTIVAKCIGIGVEANGEERWSDGGDLLYVECVGLPPFPGNNWPRVVGIAKIASERDRKTVNSIRYLKGDVTSPDSEGVNIIAHIVNDRARKWGGRGFANYISKKWPEVYKDFIDWCRADVFNFSLGHSRLYRCNQNLYVFTMICQEGYGRSDTPRVRYNALESALADLLVTANELSASVHMPRIGCGYGGGDWSIISEMIEEQLVKQGVNVTVYDLSH